MVITVHVHPRASRARTQRSGDRFDIWVTAPPTDGAANAAVLKAVAEAFAVPVSAVSLRAGARARTKLVEVDPDGRPGRRGVRIRSRQ